MAYVTPSTVTAGTSPITAAGQNIIVNDIIAHQASLVRLAYQTRATNYTISATTWAAAAELFTDVSWTADGTSAYVVEVLSGINFYAGSTGYNVYISLGTGSGTELVTMAQKADPPRAPIGLFKYFYTPSAGTATLNVRAWKEGGGSDGTIEIAAGSGRAVAGLAYIAVYGPQTT